MNIQVQGITGFIILVLDVWAIIQTFQSRASMGAKVFWTVLILILPILGFIIWLFFGPRAVRSA